MRGLFAVVLVVSSVVTLSAAPVPKPKGKTTEQKLIGKWRMIHSESDDEKGGLKLYDFYVIFKEKGELELRYEYTGDIKPQSYTGTFKVIDDDKIDYTVMVGQTKKTEVLTINKLTDAEVAWTDPDKLKESLERVKEEEKKDK